MKPRKFRKGEPVLIDQQADDYGQWRFVEYLRDGWVMVQIEHAGQTDGSQVEVERVTPVIGVVG